MNKKSFEDMDLGANYTSFDDATAEPEQEKRPRREYSGFEAQALALQGKTQGRKGAHLERFNIALTPQNADFVRTMSGVNSMPVTKYIDFIITEYRKQNGELYEQIRQLLKKQFTQEK